MSPPPRDAAIDAPPERITLDELREMERRGERVVIGDARKDAAYYGEGRRATGAIRLDPDDRFETPVAGPPRDTTIAVYCA
jgi:hypothetical protein